mgnify:CR=1 FL=1
MATGLCGTCGGSTPGCGCYVTAGTGNVVTGDGSSGSPFVVASTIVQDQVANSGLVANDKLAMISGGGLWTKRSGNARRLSPSYDASHFATQNTSTSTPVAGSGAYVIGAVTSAASITSDFDAPRLALIIANYQVVFTVSGGSPLAAYWYGGYAYTLDGTTPSASLGSTILDTAGSSAVPSGETRYAAFSGMTMVAVSPGQTLKVRAGCHWYGASANVSLTNNAASLRIAFV